jgi:hypothetical protein
MGFGKRTDFESGRTLDLDKSYRNVIKPAVQAAGFQCVRADEIVHSGLIDVPMYEQLLDADIVVADLSTSNKNAFYELGIRHALRPYTTIVIAEEGLKAPFDVNHVVIRSYKHLGEDIGFDEVMRFRAVLTDAIGTIAAQAVQQKVDSPVYRFVKDLLPPQVAPTGAAQAGAARTGAASAGGAPAGAALAGAAPAAATAALAATLSTSNASHSVLASMQAPNPSPAEPAPTRTAANLRERQSELLRGDGTAASTEAGAATNATHSALMQQVNDAIGRSDFAAARTLLSAVHALLAAEAPARPMDPYIVQRLALVTYKSKHPTEPAALQEAATLLATLDPQTSNDTETLGLWGAVHKRLWTLTQDSVHLDEAVRALERGFYLRNDYYNGINLAFLLNVRASRASDPSEAIADFVLARRVRSEVFAICDRWLKDNPQPVAGAATEQALKQDAETRYWVNATMAEAMVGLGHAAAQQSLATTYAAAPAAWMADSTRDQVARLSALLADSPLQHLKAAP